MRNLDPGKLSSALAENMRYLENVLNQTFNFDHAILSNIGVDDHHVKYTDAEVDTIVATHTAIGGAHHVKYTDAEVDAIVATHAAIAAAHHAKYTDAEVTAIIDALGWSDYTPTLTNITIGNGTMAARSAEIGDTVFVEFDLAFGSTSAMGTSPVISLPFARSSKYADNNYLIGHAYLLDSGTQRYSGNLRSLALGMLIQAEASAATYVTTPSVTATVPFTWTTGDAVHGQAVYEKA